MLAAIVESSSDGIISKDLNSVITTWNAAAERIFGYAAEEAIGKRIQMLMPMAHQAEEDDIIARIRAGEWIGSFDTVRLRKDGTPIFVSLTISPIKDALGSIVGASKIVRDISATKESERRVRELMREVNHRVKNQFAVILSMIQATGRHAANAAQFENSVRNRIMALARSHDLLVDANWSGTELSQLVLAHMRPFGADERIETKGPNIVLSSNAVQYLGMALHELGTNAAKYGAFAHRGTVTIAWSIQSAECGEQRLRFAWRETSRSTSDEIPPDGGRRSGGMGSIVLERIAPQALNGTAQIVRTPGSLSWELDAPMKAVLPRLD
ncbi:PAS domain S-box protein [Pararhizobium haloflavum]|uniref:PAS domain S-box protein n=1 Tax=Pararhizobium haloflavum TaxID=2037914 RepID=UPI001FE23EDD|nr:PAS domain S-box protein [Pararhizobium haloflavum]